jgi:hypothetical protein
MRNFQPYEMVRQVSAEGAQSRCNHHGRRGEGVEKRMDATAVERAKRVQTAHAPAADRVLEPASPLSLLCVRQENHYDNQFDPTRRSEIVLTRGYKPAGRRIGDRRNLRCYAAAARDPARSGLAP